MKEKPTDKETAKYNAIAEIAALLRESTSKRIKSADVNTNDVTIEYFNSVFTESEHETVKRKFLHLLSSL